MKSNLKVQSQSSYIQLLTQELSWGELSCLCWNRLRQGAKIKVTVKALIAYSSTINKKINSKRCQLS